MLQGLANLQQFLATRPRAERPVSGLESFAKAIPGAVQAGMQGYQMGQDIDAQRQQNVMQKLMAGQKAEEAPGAVKDLQTLLMTKTPKQDLYQKASETKIAELGDKWNKQKEFYLKAKDSGVDEKTTQKLYKSMNETEKEISELDKIKSGAEKGNLLERLKLHSIVKEQAYRQAVDVFNKNADSFGEMQEAKKKEAAIANITPDIRAQLKDTLGLMGLYMDEPDKSPIYLAAAEAAKHEVKNGFAINYIDTTNPAWKNAIESAYGSPQKSADILWKAYQDMTDPASENYISDPAIMNAKIQKAQKSIPEKFRKEAIKLFDAKMKAR